MVFIYSAKWLLNRLNAGSGRHRTLKTEACDAQHGCRDCENERRGLQDKVPERQDTPPSGKMGALLGSEGPTCCYEHDFPLKIE